MKTLTEETKYRRGDFSPCGTKRFWQKGAHYTNGQRWIPSEKYEEYRRVENLKAKIRFARS